MGSDRQAGDTLKVFFEPNSVAVVGASRTPGKFGNNILKNLEALGYQGKVYPVNPQATEINGLRSYPAVSAIADELELAIIAVPAQFVPEAMRDCAGKGVKGVVIISSGFNEAGEAGIARQQETLSIAREAGIRVIGPNTTGIMNPAKGFTTTFSPLQRKGPKQGGVAFIAQTGMFAGNMLAWIVSSQTFGISKVAGLGNKSDVADHEVLSYLAQDEETRVIMIYMEGVEEGRRFLEVARQVARTKPIVLLKGGRTAAGAKAALSHTGSLAGAGQLFDAALSQAGIVPANDLEELVDFAKMFCYQPVPRGNRAGIVSISGGCAVMAADACVHSGLEVAQLHEETLDRLQQKLPSWARAAHPIDYESLWESQRDMAYRIALELALGDDNVDLCLLSPRSMPGADVERDFILEMRARYPHKPLAIGIVSTKEVYEDMFGEFEDIGIPVYFGVTRPAKALGALYRYRQFLDESGEGGNAPV